MAAYYYVKSGGTATADAGRYATKQTGSFASLGTANYYASISDALAATTPAAAGDFVLVSNASSHSYPASATFSPTPTTGPVHILSVSDTAVDTYSKATSAQETTPSGSSITLGTSNGRADFSGLFFSVGNDIGLNGDNTTVTWRDCTLQTTGGGDHVISLTQNGEYAEYYNCTFNCNGATTSQPIHVIRSGTIKIIGGAFTTDQSSVVELIGSGGGDGALIHLIGVDLSIISSALVAIGGTSVFNLAIRFDRCELSASLTSFVDAALVYNQCVEVYNCGSGSEVDYQFYKNLGGSLAEDDTAFYRDSSTAFTEQNQKVSIKVITNSPVSGGMPFWYDLPSRYAELSVGSTDTLRIFLLSSDSGLTDQDIWAEIIYPDGTNKQAPNLLSTKKSADPLTVGSALNSNSDAWTGRTTETRYQIDLDTSVDVGADCVPILRIFVGKPSTTVYFDTTIDVVA